MGDFHLHTGSLRGRKEATLDLIITTLKAGRKVFWAKFLEDEQYIEFDFRGKYRDLTIKKYSSEGINRSISEKDNLKLTKRGFYEIKEALKSGRYQLVVMDELNRVLFCQLISIDGLLEIIEGRANGVEVLLTGEMANRELIARADLVTSYLYE